MKIENQNLKEKQILKRKYFWFLYFEKYLQNTIRKTKTEIHFKPSPAAAPFDLFVLVVRFVFPKKYSRKYFPGSFSQRRNEWNFGSVRDRVVNRIGKRKRFWIFKTKV